jgi:diguanylate cyclase (GGDEF)-like protein
VKPVGRLTASVGYALFPEDAEEAELLLRAADLAMYRAKSRGKNVVMTAAEPVR